MKVLCSNHVDIAAPVEVVFDFVTDVTRWPVWFAFVVSAQMPDQRPVELDEEVHVCLQAGRCRRQESFEVTRYLRNAFFSIEGTFSTSRRIDFRFEQRGKKTRVACALGYPVFGGLLPLIADAALVRPRVARHLSDSLVKLKGALEDADAPPAHDDAAVDVGVPHPRRSAEPVRVA